MMMESDGDYLLEVFSDACMFQMHSEDNDDSCGGPIVSSGRRGKELAAVQEAATLVKTNTRKTKKPKNWEDFATDASAINEEGDKVKERARPQKRKKGQDDSSNEASLAYLDDQSITSDGPVKSGSLRSSAIVSKERRRERNKVLARKTRVKKKAELETLRDQVASLQAENGKLKAIVKSRLPTSVGAHLLCQSDIQLPDNVASAVQSMLDKAESAQGHLHETLQKAQRSFCISNAQARDTPIVYASPGFVELTGYSLPECLGKNCRFLQGPETDTDVVAKMRKGIERGEEVQMTLKNYRKDGTSFWNHIQIAPMIDRHGKASLIIGVQAEVPVPLQSAIVSGSNTSGSDDGILDLEANDEEFGSEFGGESHHTDQWEESHL